MVSKGVQNGPSNLTAGQMLGKRGLKTQNERVWLRKGSPKAKEAPGHRGVVNLRNLQNPCWKRGFERVVEIWGQVLPLVMRQTEPSDRAFRSFAHSCRSQEIEARDLQSPFDLLRDDRDERMIFT